MKNRLVLFILLLLNLSSSAQFAGYYIAGPIEGNEEKVHFILEENGRFHIFNEGRYLNGEWKAVNKNKVNFVSGTMDLVDLFVSSGNKHPDQICFRGFGDRKAFVRIGKSDHAGAAFRPVYREEPQCPYEYYTYINVNRKECSEIAIAVKLPGQHKDTTAFVYTYAIPEKYDEIYAVVNSNAFPDGRNLSIEYKNGHYMVGNIELEKQATSPAFLAQILGTQLEQLNQDQIKVFRKALYIKNGTVEKLTPKRSRTAIQVIDNPVINFVCPDESQIPKLTLPPPKESQ